MKRPNIFTAFYLSLGTLSTAAVAANEQYELTFLGNGDVWCTAYGLMEDGTPVGQAGTTGNDSEAVWWPDGKQRSLPGLGGRKCCAAHGSLPARG